MNKSQDNLSTAMKDKEASTKPGQFSDSKSSKTAVSLGGNRWRFQGKTYQEHSLNSSVESYPQNFSPYRGNK